MAWRFDGEQATADRAFADTRARTEQQYRAAEAKLQTDYKDQLWTVDSLLEAGEFVKVLEHRQAVRISCLEEIALTMGYITADQCLVLGEALIKSPYGEYVVWVAKAAMSRG